MICRFSAPDAESVRIAFRQIGSAVAALWPASVHDGPRAATLQANVVVERSFSEPVTVGAIQALEDAGAWCLEARGVEFVRTYAALDGRRMVCLYKAPDAESVRAAQRQAAVPFERVWALQNVPPG